MQYKKNIMQDNKDIHPRYNNKGQKHGYWEIYLNDGTLYYKSLYINDIKYGYEELLTKKRYTAR